MHQQTPMVLRHQAMMMIVILLHTATGIVHTMLLHSVCSTAAVIVSMLAVACSCIPAVVVRVSTYMCWVLNTATTSMTHPMHTHPPTHTTSKTGKSVSAPKRKSKAAKSTAKMIKRSTKRKRQNVRKRHVTKQQPLQQRHSSSLVNMGLLKSLTWRQREGSLWYGRGGMRAWIGLCG